MENNETRAAEIAEKIAEILSKANLEMPDGTRIVILAECSEPSAGPDMLGLSVIRMGCDPCEAAAVCLRAVEAHDESHGGQNQVTPDSCVS